MRAGWCRVWVVAGATMWLGACGSTTPHAAPTTATSSSEESVPIGTNGAATSLVATSSTGETSTATAAPSLPEATIGSTPPATTVPSAPKCPAPADYTDALFNDRSDADAYDATSLQGDVQAISTFGQTSADFAGFDITGDKPAKVKVWVHGDLAAHTAELQALVQHHDRLEVVAAKYSSEEIDAIDKQVVADAQSHPKDFIEFASGPVGRASQVISFGLAPGDEALAQQYVDRWGDAVRIHVGDLLFVPPGCGDQPLSRTCPDVAGADPASVGLTLSLTTTQPAIEQRGSGEATLTITNAGTKRFTMDIGTPLSGVLVAPGSTHVLGVVGGTKGAGLGIDLGPGESKSIDVAFAAFRCDGGAGSAVPPGTYGLRVVLQSEEQGDPRAYLSPETPITVTTNSN